MITDIDYANWLKRDDALFTFLIEASVTVAGVDKTLYMSTMGFQTGASDVPANTLYDPVASVGVPFTEQLSLNNDDSSIAAGQLEVENYDGSRDSWYNYVWANRSIKVYIGDVRWARSDFRMVFNGVVADISPGGTQKILLKLRDRMQQVNTPVSDVKIGTGQNKDYLIPLTFGEAHNVTPILESASTLTFRVHPSQIEAVKEVRDNGVPLTGTSLPIVDLVNGKFQLVAAPSGTITASVQGDKFGNTYRNTCASLVQRIVTGYGDVTKRLTTADIDTTNFSNFDASHPQPMGVWSPDRLNILDLCRMLTGSIGAQIYFTSQGLLKIFQLTFPPVGTRIAITTADMEPRSLTPTSRTSVIGAKILGFCKNWTVQNDLLTEIPQLHKDMFGKEWFPSKKEDPAVKAMYKLTGEPVQQDTMMLAGADADVETQRQLDMWKVPHMVYEFQGLPQLLSLELGQAITVTYPRYGMSAGVDATVISIARDWGNRRVKVGFIV